MPELIRSKLIPIFHFTSTRHTNMDEAGIDPHKLAAAEQIHSNKVIKVGPDDKGKVIPQADALLTNKENVPLCVRTADCVPIFIYDPKKQAIALVHAGWKGSVLRIARKTLEKMEGFYRSKPKDLLVYFGPSIGPCCYEVGENVVHSLDETFSNWKDFVEQKSRDRYMLNLRRMNALQLYEHGVKPENIEISPYCTACRTDLFFSYRKEGPATGRIFSVLSLGAL